MNATSTSLRLLFDQNVPRPLADTLTTHDVTRAVQLGWDELVNGELIAAAEAAGFDVIVRCDKRWQYQQNLVERQIGIIVLSTNLWPHMRDHVDAIAVAVAGVVRGAYCELELPRPALVRRPPPPR